MQRETTTRAASGAVIDEPVGGELVLADVPVEERGIRGLQLADSMFPPAQRAQVAAMLQVPADSEALLPYLALCIAEGFSPWANHVWLIPKKIKIKGQDGEEDREVVKHLPAVGRDGLLHKARQSKGKPFGYRGMQFGTVCERDTFEVEWTGDLTNDPKVLHRFASKPTAFEDGVAPDRYRGRVIGAWAKLFIDGEPPVFYYANLREHGRLKQVWQWNPEARGRKPLYLDAEGAPTFAEFGAGGVKNRPAQEWEGAWDYTSSMVLKAAQSYVCRIGFGVTGFVPVDEMRDVREWQEDTGRAQGSNDAAAVADFDFDTLDVGDELRERLRRAITTANEQEAFSWGPAKCAMVLPNRTPDELAKIAGEVERENELRAERAAAREAEEETITDADVVREEGEPVSEFEDERTGENAEKVDGLKHRLADLLAGKDQTDPSADEYGQIVAEIDQVVEELKGLGVNPRDIDF